MGAGGTIARLRRKPMVKNGDYYLNYISYSKSFDVILKLPYPLQYTTRLELNAHFLVKNGHFLGKKCSFWA